MHADPITIGLIGTIFFFVLLVLRTPIGIAMGVTGLVGFAALTSFGASSSKLAIVPFRAIANYDFFVIPLFVLMANTCLKFRFGEDLYAMAYKWLAALRGGLAHATIAACAIFAAISGSSVGTCLTVGIVALEEMKKYNYPRVIACGAVVAGGTLGVMIPPSNPMILYGLMTETSIGKLFIAGIIPGIIQALLFIMTLWVLAILRPQWLPKGPRSSVKEKILALRKGGEIIVLIFILLGGLYFGWFTPTEAGAIGALASIVIGIVRKRFKWDLFREACYDTMKTIGMIYTLMIGALLMNYFYSVSKIPTEMAKIVSNLPLPPVGILAMIMFVQIILGTFMDELAMLLLLAPMFLPIVVNLGYDPIWLGVMMTLMGQTATLTPPTGINVFVIKGIAEDITIEAIFKGAMFFFFANVVLTVLLLFFPNMAIFLPRLMK